MLKHVESTKEFDELVQGDKVLVDFFATWCGPCQMLTPVIEQLSEENPDLLILKVDVDKASELSSRYSISSIPTLCMFSKGKVTKMELGYKNLKGLKAFIS